MSIKRKFNVILTEIMIEFNSEVAFELPYEGEIGAWLRNVILAEGFTLGELSFVFCSDTFLLDINREFLNHDTLTDIITFDYNLGKEVNGEVYISIDRIRENAVEYGVAFINELARVLVHGTLHLCGFRDKTDEEQKTMRGRENHYLKKARFLSY